MKRTLIVLSLLFFIVTFNQAQTGKLPEEVIATLNEKFPGVKDPEWKFKDAKYKLSFDYQKSKTQVTITEAGVWEKTEQTLKGKNIPEVITNSLDAKYPKGNYNKVKCIEKLDKPTKYKVSVVEGSAKYKLDLDEKGNILEVEKKDNN